MECPQAGGRMTFVGARCPSSKGLWTAWTLLQVACSPQGFLVAITAAGTAYQVTWSLELRKMW